MVKQRRRQLVHLALDLLPPLLLCASALLLLDQPSRETLHLVPDLGALDEQASVHALLPLRLGLLQLVDLPQLLLLLRLQAEDRVLQIGVLRDTVHELGVEQRRLVREQLELLAQ